MQEDPRNLIDAATMGADAVTGRQPLDTDSPAADKSVRYTLPANVRFAADATDCPATVLSGYAPNVSAIRFDRYGSETVPGNTNVSNGANAPALASGTSTLANLLYHVVGSDVSICLFDSRTDLRRVVRVSPGGRVRTQ